MESYYYSYVRIINRHVWHIFWILMFILNYNNVISYSQVVAPFLAIWPVTKALLPVCECSFSRGEGDITFVCVFILNNESKLNWNTFLILLIRSKLFVFCYVVVLISWGGGPFYIICINYLSIMWQLSFCQCLMMSSLTDQHAVNIVNGPCIECATSTDLKDTSRFKWDVNKINELCSVCDEMS